MKLSIITSALLLKSALAFAPVNTQQISNIPSSHGITLTPPSTSALQMAGFGGGGGMGGSKKKGKKEKKSKAVVLKPKAQWDRYVALKKSSVFRAAVRVVKEGTDAGEWYEIGKIKSEGDESTELALMLQRRIIAEVSVWSSNYLPIFSIGFFNSIQIFTDFISFLQSILLFI
jgi:hypothetical protein